VPSYAGPTAARSGDVAGTLRLLAYLALSIALILLDHRGGWLTQVRASSELLVQPLWWVAGLPGRIGEGLHDDARLRSQLSAENKVLRNALLISGARMARLQTATAENERLRGLLGAAERGGLDVQLAPILDIDLDPTRQRLILDAGSRDGVQMGQSVIDAGGLLGQIIAVMPSTATVLLLTDPDHAVPVVVARTGVRLVAYGQGRSDQLQLRNVPLSSDVKVGDSIITSGLGGRFPSGFAVGTVVRLEPDDSRAFLTGDVRPAAQLDRGRDVLLLRQQPAAPGAGSPGLGPAPRAGTAAVVTGVPDNVSDDGSREVPARGRVSKATAANPQAPVPAPSQRPRP
jgi:rod shape-determining protein MreC